MRTAAQSVAMALAAVFVLVPSSAGQVRQRSTLTPQTAPQTATHTGPAIGTHVPAFDLPDAHGEHATFDLLRGSKGLVLLFVRSADWCGYCKAQLVDFDRRSDEFRKRGLAVAAITSDTVAILKLFSDRLAVKMPLLADDTGSAAKAFGILNAGVDPVAPYPGIYLVDERGIVTAKYFDEDATERYSAGTILTREFQVEGVGKTIVDTPQATFTYSASDLSFAPGRRITLLVEIDPKPRVHLFAQGTLSYIPAEWQMGTSKAWTALPLIYPAGRPAHLGPVNETLPVYDRHVRLLRDVLVGADRDLSPVLTPRRDLGMDGAFRFQACDDRECFPPRNLMLHWSFRLSTLDAERVPEELRRLP